jgi:hypothetical protein
MALTPHAILPRVCHRKPAPNQIAPSFHLAGRYVNRDFPTVSRSAKQAMYAIPQLPIDFRIPFRINTCKSLSKQTTLTIFRMNTYKKPPGGGYQESQQNIATSNPCNDSLPLLSPSGYRRRGKTNGARSSPQKIQLAASRDKRNGKDNETRNGRNIERVERGVRQQGEKCRAGTYLRSGFRSFCSMDAAT